MGFAAPARLAARGALAGASWLLACGQPPAPAEPAPPAAPAPVVAEAGPAPADAPGDCPATLPAPAQLPRTLPEHEQLDYWLARTAAVADLDRPLLAPGELAAFNARVRRRDVLGPGARAELLAPVDPVQLADDLNSRLGFLKLKFETGAYVRPDGGPLTPEQMQRLAPTLTAEALGAGREGEALRKPELRVALDLIPIHCAPQAEPYYTPSRDLEFDRNLCSMARPQELVQILRPWDSGLALARTSYVLGWVDPERASLSPPVDAKTARRFLDGPFHRVGRDTSLSLASGSTVHVPFASLLPAGKRRGEALVATAAGVEAAAVADAPAIAPPTRPLTRRALLSDAFQYLGTPYGWGDWHGGRDCSRYLMDLFAGLGLWLPRHTSDQAVAGAEVIDLAPGLPEAERLRLIDDAHRRGAVLLHFPGHIMLYLGRDAAGTPMAIHSFAEYLVPCAGRAAGAPAGERETLFKVAGVHVSDLELGRGSSRTAFIERISKVTVLGPTRPG